MQRLKKLNGKLVGFVLALADYRMVGKKVTPEDAFQLIARYDDCLESALQERAFPMSYVRIPLYGLFAGYVHPDGCIGLNSHTDRCPDMYELFRDFLEMAGGTYKLSSIPQDGRK